MLSYYHSFIGQYWFPWSSRASWTVCKSKHANSRSAQTNTNRRCLITSEKQLIFFHEIKLFHCGACSIISPAIVHMLLTGYFATACFSRDLGLQMNWVWAKMDFILMLSSFMLCELYLTFFNLLQSNQFETNKLFFSFPISTEKQKIKIYSRPMFTKLKFSVELIR